MYGIFTYIWLIFMANVARYIIYIYNRYIIIYIIYIYVNTIHRSYGLWSTRLLSGKVYFLNAVSQTQAPHLEEDAGSELSLWMSNLHALPMMKQQWIIFMIKYASSLIEHVWKLLLCKSAKRYLHFNAQPFVAKLFFVYNDSPSCFNYTWKPILEQCQSAS